MHPRVLKLRRRPHYVAFTTIGLTLAVLAGTLSAPAVSAAAASGAVSDQFDGTSLDTATWTVVDPTGQADVSTGGGRLSIALPSGLPNDAWPTNDSTRVVQVGPTGDFTMEAGFTAVPSARYQDEGLLVEQDADDWLRFDVFHDGKALRVFMGSTVSGENSVLTNDTISVTGDTIALRISRVGTAFVAAWSADGSTWTEASRFDSGLAANRVGVYAAHSRPSKNKPAPAWTAGVDYVQLDGSTSPTTTTTTTSSTTTSSPTSTTTTTTSPTSTTTTTTSPTSTSATTAPTSSTTTTASPTSTATSSTTTSPTASTAGPTSDDFSTAPLDTRWTAVDPVGDGVVSLQGQGTADARVVLAVPAGTDHDVWDDNHGLLLVQSSADTDFGVEAKFDSLPTSRYQMQGVIVRGSADDWLRFGVFSDGSGLTAFAASTVGGVSTSRLSGSLVAAQSVRIRVTRTGPTWRFDVAGDGGAFATVGSFTQALAVHDSGVYSGNNESSGSAPAYKALVDYFFNTASPIDPEDGAGGTPTTTTTTTASSTTTTSSPTPTTSTSTTSAPPDGSFVSDDFSEASLPSRWSVVDPVGGAQVSLVGGGTQDARLAIDLPEGSNRDAWDGNGSTRVLQPVQDADITLEARFDSTPTRKYQDQGLLLQQDAGRWLRFSTYSDGSRTYAFAASTTAGTSTSKLKKTISASPSTWLRVSRSGSTWAMSVSADGSSFATIGSFNDGIAPTLAGPYAGASGSSGSVPAFTALVDYVFDTASPVSPEDGGAPADTTPPQVTNLTVAPGSQQAVVSWNTDEPSMAEVQLATGANAYVDAATTPSWSTSQSVTLTGLAPSTGYAVRIIARDTAGNTVTTPGVSFTTTKASGPQIDVWLGDDQVFGANGLTQPWANILGNVNDPDGIQSLSYSLNGGSSRSLSIGPDDRRLQYPGDFNADIAMTDLLVGSNQVVLTAVDSGGARSTRTITVRRVVAAPPGFPFTRSWSSSVDLDQQATVVDGHWVVGADGVRVAPGATGYDRVLALGDQSWTDYELTVPVTVHSFGPGAGSYLSGAPLVGLAMRWQGHQKVNSAQPAWGYKGVGAYAWFRWYDTPKLEMVGDGGSPKVNTPGTMALGAEYILKARAVTGASGTTYSFKMWRASTPEPSTWALSFTQSGPTHGSVALIAHQLDATFGTVSVTHL